MKKLFLAICALSMIVLSARAATSGDVVTYLGTGTNIVLDIFKSPFYWVPSTNCRFALSGTLGRTNAVKRLQLTINASSGFLVTNVLDTLSARTTWGQLYTGLNTIFLQWNGAQWEVWQEPAARDTSIDFGISTTQVITNTSFQNQINAIGGRASLYDASFISVSNTVTETALFTNSIPANYLGTNRTARLVISLDVLNNTGGTSNYTFGVFLGTTKIINSTVPQSAAAARFKWKVMVDVNAINSTAVQRTFITVDRGGANNALGTAGIFNGPVWGTSTEDSTAAVPFSVTITPLHAVPEIVIDKWHAILSYP